MATEGHFDCDICGVERPNSMLREIRTTRPSDPSDMCCVMYGCNVCGEGKTPAEWDEWIEGEGRHLGYLFLS